VDIDPSSVETNIVIFEVPDAVAVTAALAEDGVLVGSLNPRRVRLVTHLDVDAAGIERALEALGRALSP